MVERASMSTPEPAKEESKNRTVVQDTEKTIDKKLKTAKRRRRVREPEAWFPPRAIIARCIDCGRVLASEWGESKRVKVVYTLCELCGQRRNGLRVRSYRELGVY